MVRFDLPHVLAVRHVRDHVLWLRFSDGLEGTVDLAPRLDRGGVLSALRDVSLFSLARVEGETIVWPNGADWAPDSLHALVAATMRGVPQSNDAVPFGTRPHPVGVPEIARFFGIVITMYYADHARPHFHARCGGDSIAMEIDGDGLTGSFPRHRLALLYEWRELHRDALRANWERLRGGLEPRAIPPLE